jgi:hypothetical protein
VNELFVFECACVWVAKCELKSEKRNWIPLTFSPRAMQSTHSQSHSHRQTDYSLSQSVSSPRECLK